MSAVGMLAEYYDEAAAADHLDRVNQWKVTQPDFIAVKMTNAEIVEKFLMVEMVSKSFGTLINVKNFIVDCGLCKLINGELYKKVPNPKNYNDRHIPVIAWRD